LIDRPQQRLSMPKTQSDEPGMRKINPRLIWGASFGVWTVVTLAATITIYKFDWLRGIPTSFSKIAWMESSQILTYVPLTPLVFYLATRYPLDRRNWPRRLLLHLLSALLFAVIHVALRGLTYSIWDTAAKGWLPAISFSPPHAIRIRWDLFESLFYLNVVDDVTGTYVPIVLIAHAVSYYQRFREREHRTAQLEGQLARAHLQRLKSQLQPHFLFNTMHSISALMLSDVRAADRMMTLLSDLLRMSLENEDLQITTLSRELEFVNGYLEIEKVRFEGRLTIVFNIASETLDADVPHLLLQPLVENAVQHGISRLSAAGEIRITASHCNRDLHLTVEDNGPGLVSPSGRQSRAGLGLKMTRERLQTLYGDDQSVDIRDTSRGGVRVSVRIPFRALSRLLTHEKSEGRVRGRGTVA
jgi:two-component system, LytTR family, sensor kinase